MVPHKRGRSVGLFKAIKLILTLNCQQSSRLISDSLDRERGWAEKLAVRGHHRGCRSCRKVREQLISLNQATQLWSDESIGGESADWLSAKERIARALNDAKS